MIGRSMFKCIGLIVAAATMVGSAEAQPKKAPTAIACQETYDGEPGPFERILTIPGATLAARPGSATCAPAVQGSTQRSCSARGPSVIEVKGEQDYWYFIVPSGRAATITANRGVISCTHRPAR